MAIVYRKSQATESFSGVEKGNFLDALPQIDRRADLRSTPALELANFQAKTAQEWIIAVRSRRSYLPQTSA
jgi:hypothetical protein